ncbi:5-deoxy-glucuronate isomerase [Aeromicrobium sp. UC242_57]|uniref:5-deoxy-glucuronate isomerase n=1 Tax=Aeromicrobium sp. UC242_57 TaxID=3374624 RepID=UPI00379B1F58
MSLRHSDRVVRAGEAAAGSFALEIDPQSAGWEFSGLRILALAPGQSEHVDTGDTEVMVLSLGGSADVTVDDHVYALEGRVNVFAGPSDVVYAPRDSRLSVSSVDGGRFALASAVCQQRLDPAYLPKADVPVEMRGAGQSSRQVNNFGVPGVMDADRIIACEVLTPGGNWSSYPPHKHDEERDGETALEEIYYFEIADGPSGPGIGFQRVYGHDDAEIDIAAEVRSGDAVLIPHGWHRPLDRGTGLRHVLPQRHGRTGRRTCVADL